MAVMSLVLVGAAHAALGHPLGDKFGTELWDLVKSFGITLLAYGPFAGKVWASNAAIAQQKEIAPRKRARRISSRTMRRTEPLIAKGEKRGITQNIQKPTGPNPRLTKGK